MSALDEISKEKQRVSEALARVDAQCEKLARQLSELEAAERVLTRYNKGRPAKKASPITRPTAATNRATPAPSHGRPRTATAKTAVGRSRPRSLADQVLALATGKTQQEIAAACKGARPNHVGAALARHKRAGRIEERDGQLYSRPSTETEQQAAL